MANPDRLSALDTTFLHLEEHGTAHMHVASVMVFEGDAPSPDELVEHLVGRLHLVPRYRQRLAHVPFDQGRPVWADDPHFNPRYHVRHTALPSPGDDATLQRLAGRLFSQRLDRSKPLWEMWLVDRLAGNRFAIIAKTHHALVDGVSGVDITSVLFDATPTPARASAPSEPWAPQPLPGAAKLLGEALLERSTIPGEMMRGLRAAMRTPRRLISQAREELAGIGASAFAGISEPAPPTPFNVEIGSHRRYTWVDADLAQFKAIKDALGGTLNDAVLTAVTLALGDFLRATGYDTTDLVLKAMVPVSVRPEHERGALGNRVTAMWAPLPVGQSDPVGVFEEVHIAMDEIKRSGQAVGRAGAHRARRPGPADDRQPGGPPAGPPALLQSRRDEHPGAAAAALPARPRDGRALPGRAAGQAPGARHRDHELQRPARVRTARGLRRAARSSA